MSTLEETGGEMLRRSAASDHLAGDRARAEQVAAARRRRRQWQIIGIRFASVATVVDAMIRNWRIESMAFGRITMRTKARQVAKFDQFLGALLRRVVTDQNRSLIADVAIPVTYAERRRGRGYREPGTARRS